MQRVLALLLLIIGICVQAQAQSKPGYEIKFKITGLSDTVLYLGYYYAEGTYVRDTAQVDKTGEFVFDGKEALPQGIYFLILNKTRLFEPGFVLGANQHFALESDREDIVKNMVVKSDHDNSLFFENMHFNMERNKEAEPFIKVLQDSTLKDEAKKKEAREGFTKVNEKVIEYQNKLIAANPTTMTARLLKVNKRIDIPEPPKKSDGSIDSTFQLRYYRAHFFDNFDLSDDALIRLPQPIYSQKVNEYLDKLFSPQPDTIKKAIEFMVAKAKKNQETYKYMIFTLILKYQNPELMGLDDVFVYLNDKYFETGEMNYWANEKYRKNIKEHADRLRKSLIGNTAPNLIMLDENLKQRSMYNIKSKYTILFIFDPDCGHCKTETPKLVNFYTKNKTKLDVEVFAVSADTSMQKMRDYIKTMKMSWITVNGPRTYVGSYHDLYDAITTPTLYVIDNKKKIIGKKIPIESLEDFLTNYEKFQKRREQEGKSTP
ncbi:MAG: thioredoxin-like domain-containing protein [Cyclobacteriaceae bacterium]|nr:thioredoxin-like domain-containing protein [Cyclobacteriaceae bacterium]